MKYIPTQHRAVAESPHAMSLKMMRNPTVLIAIILIFALFYNAFLAFINSHVMRVTMIHVTLVELMIIGASVLLLWQYAKWERPLKLILSFFLFFAALYIWNGFLATMEGFPISLKPIRDMMIIFAFLILGYLYSQRDGDIRRPLIVATGFVLAFLMLELIRTDIYVDIFNISSYYLNTRNVNGRDALTAVQEPGLFFSAMSYEGRFTFGFRQAQRLSSLFLEHTTHANFAILLMIYLTSFWNKITIRRQITIILTIIMIILVTDSRQAFGMCLIILGGYYIFPHLSRFTLYLYIPGILATMMLFFYDPTVAGLEEDSLFGRLEYSISQLMGADVEALLGLRQAERIIDSGYTYILYSHSILGLIGFWLFLCTILPYKSDSSRHLAHAVMLFFTLNLAASGSTIFSIKTSALLWFMIGFMVYKDFKLPTATQPEPLKPLVNRDQRAPTRGKR